MRTAALLLGAFAIGLAAVLVLAGSTQLLNRVAVPKAIAELQADARGLAKRLGYDITGFDSHSSTSLERDALSWYANAGAQRWEMLSHPNAPLLSVTHRFSPRSLVGLQIAGLPTRGDPALGPGDLVIVTDSRGRLRGLEAHLQRVKRADPRPPNWSALFTLAGLDPAAFERIEASELPDSAADAHAAWVGNWPDPTDLPVRLEASALGGQLVFFEPVFAFAASDRARDMERVTGAAIPWSYSASRFRTVAWNLFLPLLAVAGGWVLWRSVRSGRGDRRGARRLALAVLVLNLAWWAVGAHHVASLWDEAASAALALRGGLLGAAVIWAAFMVLEPVVRGVRPDALVALTRLLRGHWFDPLVGRDVLIGLALGPILVLLAFELPVALPAVWNLPPPPAPFPPGAMWFFGPPIPVLMDGRSALAVALALLYTNIYGTLAFAFFFFALQRLLRSRIAAIGVAASAGAALTWTAALSGYSALGWALGLAYCVVCLIVLDRFGPLTFYAANAVLLVYDSYALTLDPSRPYFASTLCALAALSALAAFPAAVACGRFEPARAQRRI